MSVSDSDLTRLAADLFACRSQAVVIPFRAVTIGEWSPEENRCHDNVAHWVRHNPLHQHVRGFLYFDYGYALPVVHFNAHSVVRMEDGSLIDITPSKALDPYPFLEHQGDVDLFAAAENRIRIEHFR